jgi:hypothetical protein
MAESNYSTLVATSTYRWTGKVEATFCARFDRSRPLRAIILWGDVGPDLAREVWGTRDRGRAHLGGGERPHFCVQGRQQCDPLMSY